MCRLAGSSCFDSNVILLYSKTNFIFVSHILGIYRPLYSPTNAVMAGIFVTALVYTLWMLRVGLPERPLDIQIDNSTVVIGETKASSLLADDFTFYGKDADSEIVINETANFTMVNL